MSFFGCIIQVFYYACIGLVALAVFLILVFKLRNRMLWQLAKLYTKLINYTPVKYFKKDILTPVSKRRLQLVNRKTLILDMDLTLIASVIQYDEEYCAGRERKPTPLVYDYCFRMPESGANVYVAKRPHVDLFLERVAEWYDLVVFTSATEHYASRVLDYLDNGRGLLNSRLFRQDCVDICGIRAKFVSLANADLANVLLLDDCHMENSFNVGNSVYIKSFHGSGQDNELLCMLPFLDALRFTHDVRSVLNRKSRYDCLTSCLASQYYHIK